MSKRTMLVHVALEFMDLGSLADLKLVGDDWNMTFYLFIQKLVGMSSSQLTNSYYVYMYIYIGNNRPNGLVYIFQPPTRKKRLGGYGVEPVYLSNITAQIMNGLDYLHKQLGYT